MNNNLKSPHLRRSKNPKEKVSIRDRPALNDGIPWREEPRQEKSPSVKSEPANMLCFFKRVIVPQEMHVIAGIHVNEVTSALEMLDSGLGLASCPFNYPDDIPGSEPKKRNFTMVVAKSLDYIQAENNITSQKFPAKVYTLCTGC